MSVKYSGLLVAILFLNAYGSACSIEHIPITIEKNGTSCHLSQIKSSTTYDKNNFQKEFCKIPFTESDLEDIGPLFEKYVALFDYSSQARISYMDGSLDSFSAAEQKAQATNADECDCKQVTEVMKSGNWMMEVTTTKPSCKPGRNTIFSSMCGEPIEPPPQCFVLGRGGDSAPTLAVVGLLLVGILLVFKKQSAGKAK